MIRSLTTRVSISAALAIAAAAALALMTEARVMPPPIAPAAAAAQPTGGSGAVVTPLSLDSDRRADGDPGQAQRPVRTGIHGSHRTVPLPDRLPRDHPAVGASLAGPRASAHLGELYFGVSDALVGEADVVAATDSFPVRDAA
jgi:hypothetical protein